MLILVFAVTVERMFTSATSAGLVLFFFVSTFNFNFVAEHVGVDFVSRQTIIPHYSYLDLLFPFACLAVCSLRFFYSLVFVAVVVVVFVIFVVVIVVFEV